MSLSLEAENYEGPDYLMEGCDFLCPFCNKGAHDEEAGTKNGERACVNCSDPTFGDLNIGDTFTTEHDGRTITFRKFSIGHAQVVRDPKGVWVGCQFPFGLLAPVKVEK